MDIWTIPAPFIFALMAFFLYLAMLSMKVQKLAFDYADILSQQEGSGVSSRNLAGFSSRIIPLWVKITGWLGSLSALLVMVYVGFRFGWLWALGYVVVDHLIKSLEPPILPTLNQCYSIIEKQAQKTVPDHVSQLRITHEKRSSS